MTRIEVGTIKEIQMDIRVTDRTSITLIIDIQRIQTMDTQIVQTTDIQIIQITDIQIIQILVTCT